MVHVGGGAARSSKWEKGQRSLYPDTRCISPRERRIPSPTHRRGCPVQAVVSGHAVLHMDRQLEGGPRQVRHPVVFHHCSSELRRHPKTLPSFFPIDLKFEHWEPPTSRKKKPRLVYGSFSVRERDVLLRFRANPHAANFETLIDFINALSAASKIPQDVALSIGANLAFYCSGGITGTQPYQTMFENVGNSVEEWSQADFVHRSVECSSTTHTYTFSYFVHRGYSSD